MSIHQALFWKSNLATGYNLYLWGINTSGQLGQNDTVSRSSPVQIGTESVWTDSSGGRSANFFIKNDGTLWGSGVNSGTFTNYQLGDGTTVNKSSPIQIGSSTDWSSVRYSMASKTDGTLWAWGGNYYGQLGLGDTTDRSTPVQIGSSSGWKDFNYWGSANSAAIDSSNKLFTCGNNGAGELGLGDTASRSSLTQVGTLTDWSKVAQGWGGTHYCAIKTDGTLWTWGNGTYGGLGLGDTVSRSSPVQVGTGTNWSKVTAGSYCTLAVKTDGTLWAWGDNQFYGQLGLNDMVNRSSPVQVGTGTNWSDVFLNSSSVLALKTNGTIWGWGYNANGQLGIGDTTNRSSPVQIGALTTWNKIRLQSAITT